MLKRSMAAVVAMTALGLGAPAATADQPTADCRFRVVQEETTTGQNWEGAAWGYVIHAGDTNATIRCKIRVNGIENSSSPRGSGTTAGRVTFTASELDVVTICAEVTTNHGTYEQCFEVSRRQVPPQEVYDTADSLTDPSRPLLCSVPPAGYYPPNIYVNEEGDMWRGGTKIRDCPPYQGQEPPPQVQEMGR